MGPKIDGGGLKKLPEKAPVTLLARLGGEGGGRLRNGLGSGLGSSDGLAGLLVLPSGPIKRRTNHPSSSTGHRRGGLQV